MHRFDATRWNAFRLKGDSLNLSRRIVQFEIALRNLAKQTLYPTAGVMSKEDQERHDKEIPEIQLQLRSGSRLMQFRELGVSSPFIRILARERERR